MTRAVYNLAKKYNYSDAVKPQLSGLFFGDIFITVYEDLLLWYYLL